MVYISKWERLLEALNRVIASDARSEGEVQRDICQAIADGAVSIRAKLKRHATRQSKAANTVLMGDTFQIPVTIKPDDFDWQDSRPLRPWLVKRGAFSVPGYWEVEWIEVCRAEVTSVLCPAKKVAVSAQPASKAGATRRSQPTRKRAEGMIKELYPDGVPEPAVLPNAHLCRQVGEKLKQSGLFSVSDDTILRAAGRRK